jgi:serine/threonine-protein phosphatase 2A regulatory subunit A
VCCCYNRCCTCTLGFPHLLLTLASLFLPCPFPLAPTARGPLALQAVQSLKTVIAGLGEVAVVTTVLPVLRRLSIGDWFTARVSACALFGAVYARVLNAEVRTELRG